MRRLEHIARSIRKICFDVDNNITGLSKSDAVLWARTNSRRHAHTIKVILDYADKHNKKYLKILNASGLRCGHQDFSIANFLHKNTSINIEWTVFESPNSNFLNNNFFKKYIEELQIKLKITDFSKLTELSDTTEEAYDVIIFTEIAEHLDHSTLLKALIAIRRKMKDERLYSWKQWR